MYFMLCKDSPGSIADDGGATEEEFDYPGGNEPVDLAGGRRTTSSQHRAEEKDRRMEERKTKVLNLLSKLQDDSAHQADNNTGCSNFEDCESHHKHNSIN